MKTYNFSTGDTPTTSFFVDSEGDIFDTFEEAHCERCVAEVIVDGFYVGSLDGMRRAALEKYNSK